MKVAPYFICLLIIIGHSSSAFAQCHGAKVPSGATLEQVAVPPDPAIPVEKMLMEETARLNKSMGLNAKLFMLPKDMNAFASPNGNTYFGRPFINFFAQMKQPDGRKFDNAAVFAAVKTVLAHEFGHLLQFDFAKRSGQPIPVPSPENECQADAISGLWMGMALADQRMNGQDAFIAIQTSFKIGDTQYTSPMHHGSPEIRYSCTFDAIRVGQMQQFGTTDQAFTGMNRQNVFNITQGIARRWLQRDRNPRTF